MKKKTYANMDGLDFELLYQMSEKDYENLFNDFKVVVGWNSDIADRYNFLSDMLPTASEIERLLNEYRQRYINIETMNKRGPPHTGNTELTMQGIKDRITALENLKHAVIQLNNTGVETAREFVNGVHQHVFDEVRECHLPMISKYEKVKRWFLRKKKGT